jgi:hypothetical protein
MVKEKRSKTTDLTSLAVDLSLWANFIEVEKKPLREFDLVVLRFWGIDLPSDIETVEIEGYGEYDVYHEDRFCRTDAVDTITICDYTDVEEVKRVTEGMRDLKEFLDEE